MGEKKRRSLTLEAFVQQHPWCCFCGGSVPTTTRDHQPATICFPRKDRPKGLEFPACERCNSQTKYDEALLAFVCRLAGSLRSNSRPDYERISGLPGTIEQAFPGLLARMGVAATSITREGKSARIGAFDLNQPQIAMSFCKIAAKLALATYYKTSNRIAPERSRIHAMWEHSQDP